MGKCFPHVKFINSTDHYDETICNLFDVGCDAMHCSECGSLGRWAAFFGLLIVGVVVFARATSNAVPWI